MGKLNDKAVAGKVAGVKQVGYADGGGLTLIVKPLPAGSKLWWFRYRFNGKAKTLSLGQYPAVSLKQAREWTLDARKLLAAGVDPGEVRKEVRTAAVAVAAAPVVIDTVEAIAREWFQKFSFTWVDSHASKVIRRLERDLFPWFEGKGIHEIKPHELLHVLRRVEARGALDTAHRLMQNCGQIWRYAVATGRAERDITSDLKGAIPPARETHLGSITDPKEVGALLRNIDAYKGSEVVRFALKLSPYFFVRPGELRQAAWSEFDLESCLWTIPAGRMKARRPHVVPLSRQVLSILGELKTLTGGDGLLFPSPRSKTRCLSDVALLAALQRMGYEKGEMTAHGFRALASTNLEQLGYDSRLIEIQLAHADADSVRAAYKRETHLMRIDERRLMMERWSDYLDSLRTGAAVLPFNA